jgi:hypothetical protein
MNLKSGKALTKERETNGCMVPIRDPGHAMLARLVRGARVSCLVRSDALSKDSGDLTDSDGCRVVCKQQNSCNPAVYL